MNLPSELCARGRRFFVVAAKRGAPAPLPRLDAPAEVRDAARRWEEDWGGFEFDHHELGIAAAQEKLGEDTPLVCEHEGLALVLVGHRWSQPIYLDPRGRLYSRPLWWPTAPVQLLAESTARYVARHSLRSWLGARRLSVELDRRMGAALAEALALPELLSGGWWGEESEDGLFVGDGDPFAPDRAITSVQGPVARVNEALRRARALDPEVGAYVHSSNPERLSLWPTSAHVVSARQAPELPACDPRRLPLRHTAALPWHAPTEGVVDLSDDDGLRVLEVFEGRVLSEWRFDEEGQVKRLYQDAQERIQSLLSPEARGLVQAGAHAFDPRDRLTRAQAREVLQAHGTTATEALLDLEESLGGLTLSESWQLGFHGLRWELYLRELGRPSTSESERVPFATSGDTRLLVDAHGHLYFSDDIDGTDHLLAESASTFLEREIRMPAGLDAYGRPSFRLDRFCGTALASALGVRLDVTLSDAAERYWLDGAIRIHEQHAREGEVMTTVTTTGLEGMRRVVAALPHDARGATASTPWTEVRELLEEAGVSVRASVHEKRWEPAVLPDVQRLIAALPRLPLEELGSFASHPSAALRRAVAELPTCPVEVLSALVESAAVFTRERASDELVDEIIVLDAVARHPRGDAALRGRLMALELPTELGAAVRRALAMHPEAGELWLPLSADPSPWVRAAVAGNERASTTTLAQLGADPDERVRAAAARNPATPPDTIARLGSTQEDGSVLRAVAANPSTPDATLLELSRIDDGALVFALSRRPELPELVAERCAFHPHGLPGAVHRALSLTAIEDLAASPSDAKRTEIAKNPATPSRVLLHLLEDDDPAVRSLALGHPNLDHSGLSDELLAQRAKAMKTHPAVVGPWRAPPGIPDDESLGALLDRRSGDHRDGWARHASYPPCLLHELVSHPGVLTTYNVAAHPWVPEEVLSALAEAGDHNTQLQVAYNPRTPSHTLVALTRDPHPRVRAAAASHPSLPPEVLEELATEQDEAVLERVAQSPHCPVHTLESLARHPAEYVRRRVASHPRCPHAVLALLVDDTEQVSSRVPLNPSCPAAIAWRALRSSHPQTRNGAVWRLLHDLPLSEILSAPPG